MPLQEPTQYLPENVCEDRTQCGSQLDPSNDIKNLVRLGFCQPCRKEIAGAKPEEISQHDDRDGYLNAAVTVRVQNVGERNTGG